MTSTDTADVREAVREHYAGAAAQAASGAVEEARKIEAEAACCGTDGGGCAPASAVTDGSFGATLYGAETSGDVPQAAFEASLGCGVPTAVADLHAGETVLDLGSGAGADVRLIDPARGSVRPCGAALREAARRGTGGR
jgi:arsenite methyltransferase